MFYLLSFFSSRRLAFNLMVATKFSKGVRDKVFKSQQLIMFHCTVWILFFLFKKLGTGTPFHFFYVSDWKQRKMRWRYMIIEDWGRLMKKNLQRIGKFSAYSEAKTCWKLKSTAIEEEMKGRDAINPRHLLVMF